MRKTLTRKIIPVDTTAALWCYRASRQAAKHSILFLPRLLFLGREKDRKQQREREARWWFVVEYPRCISSIPQPESPLDPNSTPISPFQGLLDGKRRIDPSREEGPREITNLGWKRRLSSPTGWCLLSLQTRFQSPCRRSKSCLLQRQTPTHF